MNVLQEHTEIKHRYQLALTENYKINETFVVRAYAKTCIWHVLNTTSELPATVRQINLQLTLMSDKH